MEEATPRWADRKRAERAAEVIELRSQGLTLQQISDAMGIGLATAHRDLVGEDSTPSPAGQPADSNGGKPMTTPTTTTDAPADEDLATVRQRLADAEAKAAKYEAQIAAQNGVQTHDRRAAARMPTERPLRSGALPESAEVDGDVDYGKIAEKIFRNGRGW